MRNVFDKWFKKLGTKTVRVNAAVLRHPTKTAEEIRVFLDDLMPKVESGKISNAEFEAASEAFYGNNPTLIFVGYVALRKDKGRFELLNMQTGEWCGTPLAGDIIIRIDEFEEMLKAGDIQLVKRAS
jgi:hypothetical protein